MHATCLPPSMVVKFEQFRAVKGPKRLFIKTIYCDYLFNNALCTSAETRLVCFFAYRGFIFRPVL